MEIYTLEVVIQQSLLKNTANFGGEKGVIVRKGDKLENPDFGKYTPIVYNGSIKWINNQYLK